jgi:hypothetical protein
MKEDLLHFIWHQKILVKQPLKTTSGKPIQIVKTGSLNTNAGPDFFDARIRIGDTLWAGNVEIHLKSSDWIRHNHHTDNAYSNVILHVVYEHDKELGLSTLELKNYLPESLLNTYLKLQRSASTVPCQNVLSVPEEIKLDNFLYRLAIERLENKCERLEKQLYQYRNSWEKLFYVTLAKYFGMQVNAQPFVQMAEFLPAQLLARHKYKPEEVYALIFGVAGFLPVLSKNEHIMKLNREFRFMQTKYDLPSLPRSMWKYARTRPANFPTTRLAQFAALVCQSSHLFSKLMLAGNTSEAKQLLCVSVPEWLDTGELYPARHIQNAVMGEQFLQNLLINVVVPVKFLYGKHTINEALCEQALNWLETLGAETNVVTKFWKSNGIKPKHALHSQSLIQLHTSYCSKHQCLKCAIGNHILYKHV